MKLNKNNKMVKIVLTIKVIKNTILLVKHIGIVGKALMKISII